MFEIEITEDVALQVDGWKLTLHDGDNMVTYTNVLTGLQAGQLIYELFSETVSAKPKADLCGSTPATRCGSKCDC